LVIGELDLLFSDNENQYILGGINTSMVIDDFNLSKYIIDKEDTIKLYINKLQAFYRENKITRTDQILMKEIINTIDNDFIINLCLLHFLLIYTYQNSDNDKNYNLLSVSITIGNKLINKYFNILLNNHNSIIL
jgi:hypothetical protein